MKKSMRKLCGLALALALLPAVPAQAASFEDVAEDAWYAPAVNWAVEEGITNGVSDSAFDPDGRVDRAQVVTFLWRMAGQPASEGGEAFTDVEADSWYAPAVRWAVEKGITLGTGEGKFSPDTVCDRAMCLTLLYRLMDSPLDAAAAAPKVEFREDLTLEEIGIFGLQQMIEMFDDPAIFPDVEKDAYYALPVVWGGMNGILTAENTGAMVEGVRFRPVEPCVRAEMVSFLYQTRQMLDRANAPEFIETEGVKVPVPQKYSGLLYRSVYSGGDGNGIFLTVSELASRKAAEALGEDPDETGAGVLFSLGTVDEEKLREMLCGDMSGAEVFARDGDGKYYVFYHPTDVRYVRESTEQMTADQEQWSELAGWAYSEVRDGILSYSEGLTPVYYTNTDLDMELARVAYQKDVKYTLSTTEFGPLEPGSVDPAPYVEALLRGGFAWAEEQEAPDGQYVVLNFPESEVRYDFFFADGGLVRQVRGENETIYKCVHPGDVSNTDTMQSWYQALAKAAGK